MNARPAVRNLEVTFDLDLGFDPRSSQMCSASLPLVEKTDFSLHFLFYLFHLQRAVRTSVSPHAGYWNSLLLSLSEVTLPSAAGAKCNHNYGTGSRYPSSSIYTLDACSSTNLKILLIAVRAHLALSCISDLLTLCEPEPSLSQLLKGGLCHQAPFALRVSEPEALRVV